jgi:GR25 family glycosyltransferase involved in LPS biosynthesis
MAAPRRVTTIAAVQVAELPLYVVHGRRLVDRRDRLSSALAAQGLVAEWVAEPDAATLTRAHSRRYYRPSRRLWRARAVGTPSPNARFRRLTRQEIAATISHVEILRKIAAGPSEWALVFEDDAILDVDFRASLTEQLGEMPDDADVVFLGGAFGFRVRDADPGQRFYRRAHPAGKPTDSYLVRRSAAAKLVTTIVPFVFPIDWELSYQLMAHDLVVYWLEPPLVSQGSYDGVYESSIAYDRWRLNITRRHKLRLATGRLIRRLPGGPAALAARRRR